MRLRSSALLATALFSVAACHPREIHHGGLFHHHDDRPMRVAGKLDCPDQVDELTRTAEAADGASCTYSGPQSEDVQLSLMSLDGATPDARLVTLDQSLKAEVPGAAGSQNPWRLHRQRQVRRPRPHRPAGLPPRRPRRHSQHPHAGGEHQRRRRRRQGLHRLGRGRQLGGQRPPGRRGNPRGRGGRQRDGRDLPARLRHAGA